MRSRICLAVLLTAMSALGFLKSYEVMPVKASWSGWTRTTPGQHYVAQTITANFDSVAYCELFVGERGSAPATPYLVQVRDDEDNLVAFNDGEQAAQDHIWLKLPLTTVAGRTFTRGKQYLFKFTRPGDSIQFYYDPGDPYGYGEIEVPGVDQPPPASADVCMRVFGKARVGTEFGVQSVMPFVAYEAGPVGSSAEWEGLVAKEADLGIRYDKTGYAFWPLLTKHSPLAPTLPV